MKWMIPFVLILSITSHAEVAPAQVDSMLQQMVRENVISPVEAEKAKIRMKSMSPEQWSAINKQAQTIASRSPASAVPSNNKIEEVHGIDLDGAQFKNIVDEVKKIVPQYRD